MNDSAVQKQDETAGWRVVAGVFVLLVVTSGLGFYNHSVMLQALEQRLDYPLSVLSLSVSLFFVVSGVTGLFVARAIERFDPRLPIGCGAVCGSAALYWIGQVNGLVELLAAYALFAVGFSACGLLPGTALVTGWFERRRAFALSIATSGLSVGGVVLTPMSAWAVSKYGIAAASPWLAMVFLFGVLLPLLLIRRVPGSAAQAGASVSPTAGWRSLLVTRFFMFFNAAYVLTMLAQVGGIAHQYGLLVERVPLAVATSLLAVLPVTSMLGRLIGGVLLERLSMRGFAAAMMLTQTTALFLLSMASTRWTLGLGLALFGFSVGNLLMLQPLLIAERYGTRLYARLFSLSNLMSTAGVAMGPALLGLLASTSADYAAAYRFAAAAGLLACLLFLLAGPVRGEPVGRS